MNTAYKLALLFFLCVSAALAQNALVPIPPTFLGPTTAPRLGAGLTITFCTSTATGLPCSPLAQAYADATNGSPINQGTNPLHTDALGNAPVFYAAPGQYSYTITGLGLASPQGPYQVTVSCIPGVTCVSTSSANTFSLLQTFGAGISGTGNTGSLIPGSGILSNNNAWTGSETHSNSETFSGTITATGPLYDCQQNNLLYVGGPITCWAGSDIGAQINTAYAALPSTGGEIDILPQANGSCYSYSTPIVMTTIGKFATVRGLAPNSINGSFTITGVCLIYTPTTATNAVSLDWGQASGSANTPGSGWRDVVLWNNSCGTLGGCGSSAVGFNIGATNGGMGENGLFYNVGVYGFHDGYKIQDNIGWGIRWFNCTVRSNLNGITYTKSHENDSFVWGSISSNGTGVTLTNGGGAGVNEFNLVGGSMDDNSTCGVTLAADATLLHANDVHWENAALGIPAYVCGATANSRLDIKGGSASDDVTTSTYGSPWFQAGYVSVSGLHMYSGGRTTSVAPFTINTRGKVQVVTASNSFFTSGFLVNSFNNSQEWITNPNQPALFGTGGIMWAEGSAPTAFDGNAAICYDDSTAHALKCSYNSGSYLNMPQVIASGTATMTTAAITAGNCGTTVTVSASGVATTDTITWAFNAAPAGSNAGIVAWPTANNVNFAYCSNTAQTPAAATINWRVVR